MGSLAFGSKADIVLIDGGHEYLDVRDDVDAWWPFVKPGGVLVADDMFAPNISRVIREKASREGVQVEVWRKAPGGRPLKGILRKPA